MKRAELNGLMKHMRAIGPAAVMAAALVASPAFAQSSTTTSETRDGLTKEKTKTETREHADGSVSAESTTKKKIGGITVGKEKSSATVVAPEPAPSTTTTTTHSTTSY